MNVQCKVCVAPPFHFMYGTPKDISIQKPKMTADAQAQTTESHPD